MGRQQFWQKRVSPRLWILDQNNLGPGVPDASAYPRTQVPFRKGKFWKWQQRLFVDQSSHYFAVTLDASTTTVPSMVRAVANLVSVTETTSPTIVRSVGKVLSKTETTVPTITRAVGKSLSVTETTSPSMTRAIAKLLSLAETTSPSMQRAVAKLLSVLETTVPGEAIARAYFVTLSAATTTSPSIATVKTVGIPKSVGGGITRAKSKIPKRHTPNYDTEPAAWKRLEAKWLRDNIDDEELLAILLKFLDNVGITA